MENDKGSKVGSDVVVSSYISNVFGKLVPEDNKILIVGDGDFSYSASLCKLYNFGFMISTSFCRS